MDCKIINLSFSSFSRQELYIFFFNITLTYRSEVPSFAKADADVEDIRGADESNTTCAAPGFEIFVSNDLVELEARRRAAVLARDYELAARLSVRIWGRNEPRPGLASLDSFLSDMSFEHFSKRFGKFTDLRQLSEISKFPQLNFR